VFAPTSPKTPADAGLAVRQDAQRTKAAWMIYWTTVMVALTAPAFAGKRLEISVVELPVSAAAKDWSAWVSRAVPVTPAAEAPIVEGRASTTLMLS
jgi:hypothetical protein